MYRKAFERGMSVKLASKMQKAYRWNCLMLFSLAVLTTTACASLTSVTPDPYTPRFENASIASGTVQKSNAAMAIIAPGGDIKVSTPVGNGQLDRLPIAFRLVPGGGASQPTLTAEDLSPGFKTFKTKMLREFERIALAKGLTVKAAYESLDVMTYNDKRVFAPLSGSFCGPVLLNALSEAAFLVFSPA